jgi:hypothetical protein
MTLALLLLAGSTRAHACDCAYEDLRTEFLRSDAVFIGVVTVFEPVREVTLTVEETLRGTVPSPIVLTIGTSDCDYFLPPHEPTIGQRLLIFTYMDDGTRTVTHCGRSGPVDERGSVLDKLRELVAAPDGPSAGLQTRPLADAG